MFDFIMDFITKMGTAEFLLILAAFIVFIYLTKKIVRTIINALWIILASVLFPVFLIKVFNYPMPLNVATILSFVTMGLALYLVYLLGKAVYQLLSIAEKGAKLMATPFTWRKKKKKEKMEKRMEKFIKEKDKEGKKEAKETPKDEESIDASKMRQSVGSSYDSESVLPRVVGRKEKKTEKKDEKYLVIKEEKNTNVEPLKVIKKDKKKEEED